MESVSTIAKDLAFNFFLAGWFVTLAFPFAVGAVLTLAVAWFFLIFAFRQLRIFFHALWHHADGVRTHELTRHHHFRHHKRPT